MEEMMNMTKKEAAEVIREVITVCDVIYAHALEIGPHNPDGTPERAEELTRAYMTSYLRTENA